MAANEKAGRVLTNTLAHATVVAAWVPADVRHPYVQSFAGKAKFLWIPLAHFGVVDVPIYAMEWPEPVKLLTKLPGAKVTGMPNLITTLEVIEYFGVKKPMGVRDQADPLHYRLLCVRHEFREGGFIHFFGSP